MSEIKENLIELEKRINDACSRVGRKREEIKVLLATKTVSNERILEAVKLGYPFVGENKVQELLTKFKDIHPPQVEWNFIGHLQTNKVKDVLGKISLLHSVDRWSLVEELNRRLAKENQTLDILIQVNTSNEESKYGVSPDEVLAFLRKVLVVKTLNVKGFMTLAALSSDPDVSRECFKILKNVQQQAQTEFGREFPELSMGMSSDFEGAIEEGATIIRVGTTIFGQRKYADSYYWPSSQ